MSTVTIDNATGEVTIEQLAIDIYDCDTAVLGGSRLVAAFKGLDFVAFTAKQKELITQLVTAKLSANPEAAATMFLRVTGNLGIVKPKATGEASVKADKRELAKTEFVKLIEKAGVTAESTAKEILALAGKATGAVQQALTNAAIVKNKETEKAVSKAKTARKAEMCKALKLCDDDKILDGISKMLALK
tara:strand:+ start:79 stop:645 length:567 start_codon:yes stop_codon:yes gene_type:complete